MHPALEREEAGPTTWPSAGGYQPFVELGRGGMGVAYLARRCYAFERDETRSGALPEVPPSLGVVKRPHAHLMRDVEMHRRFHHEAALATSVRHPCLIETRGAGEDRHGPYLLLEYVHGTTLEDLADRAALRGAELPFGVGAYVAHRCLGALHALHHAKDRRGTPLYAVHRDVSPQNVLLSARGEVKLSDLGVAKSRLRLASTDTRSILGKLQFLAPEYLRERRTGPSLDVYALGITLWTALAGRLPFVGKSESAVLIEIFERGARPLAEVRPDCPPQFAALVDRACSPNAEARIGVTEMQRELNQQFGDFEKERAQLPECIERWAGADLRRRSEAWGLDPSEFAGANVGGTIHGHR